MKRFIAIDCEAVATGLGHNDRGASIVRAVHVGLAVSESFRVQRRVGW